MEGEEIGRTIFEKIFHSPAPSILAASIRESGIDIIYWRIRNMANTLAAPGMI